jgi:phytoene dehydrogenase-like protein
MNVVVGAGPAGLACALALARRGEQVTLLEAGDGPGGRLRTKKTAEGFLLDRGFQVLLDNYHEAMGLFEPGELEPCFFRSGALIWTGERLARWENPLRHGSGWLNGILERSLPWQDKLRLAWLAAGVLAQSEESLREAVGFPGGPSLAEALPELGFSSLARTRFFQPFFGGVLLDSELATDFRLVRLYLRRFALGRAFIPRGGIGQFGKKLAAKLPTGTLQLGARVVGFEYDGKSPGRIVLAKLVDGRSVFGERFFVCCEAPASREILPSESVPLLLQRPGRSVRTFYFSLPESVVPGPWLVLNGSGEGPIAHLCEVSQVDRSTAPAGRHLLSVTVLQPSGNADDFGELAVQAQLREIFPATEGAELIEQVEIPWAVPQQNPGFLAETKRSFGPTNLHLAGDQIGIASTEESVRSGLDVVGQLC